MTGRSAVLVAMALGIVAIGATAGSERTPRFVWNVSGSVPTGLYRVRPASDLTVATIVAAYPPEPLATWLAEGGYLPRGVPLLKRVLALEGQTVCRIGPIIWVDGRQIGAARKQDHSGRPLPVWRGCRVIGADEVFLMNPDEPASLDGRYFGPLPLTSIAGLAEPLWTSAENQSGEFKASSIPLSGRDAHAPATLRQVGKCRLAFHVHHFRGAHHGPHDAHYRLRSDTRSEAHARADLAPIGRRTMGVLGIGRAPAAGPAKHGGGHRCRARHAAGRDRHPGRPDRPAGHASIRHGDDVRTLRQHRLGCTPDRAVRRVMQGLQSLEGRPDPLRRCRLPWLVGAA